MDGGGSKNNAPIKLGLSSRQPDLAQTSLLVFFLEVGYPLKRGRLILTQKTKASWINMLRKTGLGEKNNKGNSVRFRNAMFVFFFYTTSSFIPPSITSQISSKPFQKIHKNIIRKRL